MVPNVRTLCIGAAHWDILAMAAVAPEAGGDLPGRIARRPGGVAGNVAAALGTGGADPILLTAIGADADGTALAAALSATGIDMRYATRGAETDRYAAIAGPDGALFAAVADCRALETAGLSLLAPLLDGRLARPASRWREPVVIDGNLPTEVIARLGDILSQDAPIALVVASAEKADRLEPVMTRSGATLYLNRAEAEALTATALADSRAAAQALLQRGVPRIVVTDGAAAATAAGPDGEITLPPPSAEGSGLTGAGDHLVAAHILARASGMRSKAALAAALAGAAKHIRAVA